MNENSSRVTQRRPMEGVSAPTNGRGRPASPRVGAASGVTRPCFRGGGLSYVRYRIHSFKKVYGVQNKIENCCAE